MRRSMLSGSRHLSKAKHSTGNRLILRLCCMMMFFMLGHQLQAEDGFVVNMHVTAEFYGNTLYAYEVSPQSIYTCSDDAVVALSIARFELDDINVAEIGSIVKLDAFGNLLWQRTFRPPSGDPRFDWIAGIGIDANDAVSFIIGRWENSYQKYLVEVDENGLVTSTPLNLDIPDNNATLMFNKALRCPSGDFIAVGNIRTNAMNQKNLAYFRFSPNAQVLASSFIPPDSTWFSLSDIYDAEIEESGNLLMSCRINPYHNDLLRLNMDGIVLERLQLQGILSYIGANPVSLAKSPGSEHSIVSYCDYPPYPEEPSFYIALIADGGLWYQTISESNIRWVNSMIEVGADVYLVAYHHPNGFSLLRLNYTDVYEVVWAWNHPGFSFMVGDFSLVYHLLSSSVNSCIYVAGYNGSMLAVAKVLPNGQLPVEDEVQTPSVNKISAYPNPMKEYVNIKINQDSQITPGSIAVEIYNIRGQLMKTLRTAKDGAYVWDGTDNQGRACPSGIYLIKDSMGLYKLTKIVKAK